jgi:hypothetical protein
MKKEILSEELNAMKYLLGYKRGVVISEQQAPETGTPVPATPATAPSTAAPVVAAPTTGTTAAPTTAAAPATNLSVPDLIKQIQTILITKFKATLGNTGPNKDGVDGVWGKNTQAALESAIKTLPAAVAAPTTGTTTVVAGAPAAGAAPAAAAPTTGAPAAGAAPVAGAAPATQFNFNPNPNLNLNPQSGVNFKLQTPQELAKGLTTATPKL